MYLFFFKFVGVFAVSLIWILYRFGLSKVLPLNFFVLLDWLFVVACLNLFGNCAHATLYSSSLVWVFGFPF